MIDTKHGVSAYNHSRVQSLYHRALQGTRGDAARGVGEPGRVLFPG